MVQSSQLAMDLFQLSPLDRGLPPTTVDAGGLSTLEIRNFKGIQQMDVHFDPITLLVGANNSGKTTILQAIRLFYYCLGRCAQTQPNGSVILKKNVTPFAEFTLIPAHELRELVYQGATPNTRSRGIRLLGSLYSGLVFEFMIYGAYSTLLVIDPVVQTSGSITAEHVDASIRQPLYVPGFSGIVTRELLATDRRVEQLIVSGQHNEVLRNLVLRLRSMPETFDYLVRTLKEQFNVTFKGLPANPTETEFLRAAYDETGFRLAFDIVSAGSGFLQILQFLAHALQSPSPVLLLDEPDAHMHVQLQESFMKLLRTFAAERSMQVIMASHSETILRQSSLNEIRLIDRRNGLAQTFTDPIVLQNELNDEGVWPQHSELTEALRIKRLLLCESAGDAELLMSLGLTKYPTWGSTEKIFQVIETEGTNDNTVARVEFLTEVLTKMLNGDVKVAYLRDRDLLCDERLETMVNDAKEKNLHLFITTWRNRESYLVHPSIVERAILASQDHDTLPENWSHEGEIAGLVKQWCLEFCDEEKNEVPVKIREYNNRWIQTNHEEVDARREAQARLEQFVQDEWHHPLDNQEIPWTLMDGKGALKYVRRKLAEHKIMLGEKLLLDNLEAAELPGDLLKPVDLLFEWSEQQSG